MKISFNEDMIIVAKRMLVLNHKRNKYKNVFDLLKDDIFKLVEIGLNYNSILELLNSELQVNIKYHTFFAWIQKNIKQKNQNSNNLKRNTKKDEVKKDINNPKKEIPKQNNTTSTTPNTPKKEDDDKPWWKKRVEELSKGMKEAGVRR